MTGLYAAAYLFVTFLSGGRSEGVVNLLPLESVLRALRFDSGVGGFLASLNNALYVPPLSGILFGYIAPMEGILLNILLFVPAGLLFAAARKDALRSGRRRFVLRVARMGFALSLATEVLQLVTRRGWFDVNDLVNNTLGAALGAYVFTVLTGRANVEGRDWHGT